MNIISARSPFQIIINETGQIGSKVELFIWNKGTTEPTNPTYIMSENIASVTQTETNYNISPYILEYINQINVNYSATPVIESNTDWCLVRVKTYKNVAGTYTLLTNVVYIGVNGYTEVSQGLNYMNDDYANLSLLGYDNNSNYKIQYYNLIPYYNFILKSALGINFSIKYYLNNGTLLNSNTFRTATSANYYNYRLPLAYNNSDYCEIENDDDGVLYRVYTEKLDECKYTPVNVSYVNRFGGWQQLTFFKAHSNKINVKGSKYSLLQSNVNYNPLIGQSKAFNINGTWSITCNTGWVYENYNKFIQELMLSDTILVDNIPATIKTQSLTYKTQLKDKNINFEIDFEFSNNLINDVI
jgi:hypothetical protein